MNAKVKKYIGPILGLIGSLLFLVVGISSIAVGGYIRSIYGGYIGDFFMLLTLISFVICVFGLIGAILGFFGRRRSSKYLMLIASGFALIYTI
ncbi:MAG: hypothetical protein JSV62_09950 [Promethearchaeota archaeon]|nr:MAG: hypothetical protein JSV62_09950 [Candidatus Lokiarchaeota archaeon]